MNFSIVIPLYNKENYICRAVDSVLNQTNQNFEIIIINDGSTDSSAEKVQKYSDPRIRLIQQKNMGVSSSRNNGIKVAKYDYIALLDGDDEWKPCHLETIEKLIVSYPEAGIFITGREHYNKNEEIVRVSLVNENDEWSGVINDYFKFVYEKRDFLCSSSSVVIPKKILNEVGMFPENETHREDIDLWVRISLRYPTAYSNKVGARIYLNTVFNSNTSIKRDNKNRGYTVIQTIEKAIEQGLVEQQKLEYCNWFLDYLRLGYIILLIKSDLKKKARKALSEVKTKEFIKMRNILYLLTYTPNSLLDLLMHYRKKIKYGWKQK